MYSDKTYKMLKVFLLRSVIRQGCLLLPLPNGVLEVLSQAISYEKINTKQLLDIINGFSKVTLYRIIIIKLISIITLNSFL